MAEKRQVLVLIPRLLNNSIITRQELNYPDWVNIKRVLLTFLFGNKPCNSLIN